MQPLVADVLRVWREAERMASDSGAGTPEHAAATLAVDRLRELYADLVRELQADDREQEPLIDPMESSTATGH